MTKAPNRILQAVPRMRSRRLMTRGSASPDPQFGCQGLGDPRNTPLSPHPNAIDATIHVTTGVMTDRSARHRTRPEHNACAGNASLRIFDVLAVHDRLGRRWIECETCKSQQDTGSNAGHRRGLDRKMLLGGIPSRLRNES